MPLKFSSLTTNAAPTLGIEFTSILAGRTIASCSVEVEMYEQTNETDPSPASTLNGAAATNEAEFELETETGVITVPPGAAVLQPVLSGRVIGATYLYRFIAVLSDNAQYEEDGIQTITKYSEP